MEQKPPAPLETFTVFWHKDVQDDLKLLQKDFAQALIAGTAHKLSQAPHLIGHPLRGTMNQLWKVKFNKFRITYTINMAAKEVWVLSVKKREIAYEVTHLNRLKKLAAGIWAKQHG